MQFIVNGNRRCENCKSGADTVVMMHMVGEEFNYRGRKGVYVFDMQHTATHCNTLQHTATTTCICYVKNSITDGEKECMYLTCNTLQHIATHCNTLQHTATTTTCICYVKNSIVDGEKECMYLTCNTLQHIATHCNTLQQQHAYVT